MDGWQAVCSKRHSRHPRVYNPCLIAAFMTWRNDANLGMGLFLRGDRYRHLECTVSILNTHATRYIRCIASPPQKTTTTSCCMQWDAKWILQTLGWVPVILNPSPSKHTHTTMVFFKVCRFSFYCAVQTRLIKNYGTKFFIRAWPQSESWAKRTLKWNECTCRGHTSFVHFF